MNGPDLAFARWTTEEIAHQADAAIAAKQAALSAIKGIPHGERTFANTIAALEHAGEPFAVLEQTLQLLMNVHEDTAVRESAQGASARMDEANVRMEHDRELYEAAMAWERTGELERLSGGDRKLADDTLRDLRRMGFGLPAGPFEELQRNWTELKRLGDAFEKAINDWEDGIEVNEAQLEGLPASYRDGLTRSDKGTYRITLQYPDYLPFMRLAHDDAARRELATKGLRRGGFENLERLASMIRIRQRNAELLGYPTHADFTTETRMAKTGAAAAQFIRSLIEKLSDAARAELRDLIAIKKRILGLEKPSPIGFHEVTYWSERLRQERYDLDAEAVRAYFPLETVLRGMMALYGELFGLRFERSDASAWHADATVYAMLDQVSGERLGSFVTDLYPRPGKYGHAAVFPVRLAGPDPLVALVCNFSRPSSSHPSQLSHDEVETLFHEFGHLVHSLVSARTPYPSQNGLGNIATDFVEAPSQLLEEWTWHPAVLHRISAHRDSREPMPDELIQKMIRARHHMDANYYLAQAVMALYDLRMHGQPTNVEITADDIARWFREMELEYRAIDMPEDAIQAAGWTHMADYDAAYYGYLWSKVYALDLFTRFADDPLDARIGRAYRRAILEPGASRPEMDSIRDFLGREGSDAAFLAALGIAGKH